MTTLSRKKGGSGVVVDVDVKTGMNKFEFRAKTTTTTGLNCCFGTGSTFGQGALFSEEDEQPDRSNSQTLVEYCRACVT